MSDGDDALDEPVQCHGDRRGVESGVGEYRVDRLELGLEHGVAQRFSIAKRRWTRRRLTPASAAIAAMLCWDPRPAAGSGLQDCIKILCREQ